MTRGATARLFLAIDPPTQVSEQLAAWAREALGPGLGKSSGADRPVRLLAPDLLHLTICFLGARPVAEIEAIAAALGECATPVGELTVGAPLWLPPRRPRVLAVELHDPGGDLERLHETAVEAIPGAAGVKRFRPHITLARMREGVAGRVGLYHRELPPTPALTFTPTELVLYRSWLDPEGATYEALASATLIPA